MQGLHTMTAAAYHADPAPEPSLSNSLIKVLLGKSPLHAWFAHPRLNPNWQPHADSKFDVGTAAHGMLLEGVDKCVAIDAPDWRGKEAKTQRDAARAMGLTPLLAYQHEQVRDMVEVAKDFIQTTELAGIMEPEAGSSERVMMWTEGPAGITAPSHTNPFGFAWMRGMLDRLSTDGSVFLDYKTTSARNPGDFIRSSMTSFGYDTQHSFYRRGLSLCGFQARGLFLVQEDSEPYACYLVEPSESMQEMAALKVKRAIALWSECMATGKWPAYGPRVHYAEAPAWALREEMSNDVPL